MLIRYDGITIPEEIPYAFFVGYVHDTPNKSKLSSKNISKILESIGIICPNLTDDYKKNLTKSLYLQTDVIEKILEWKKRTGGCKVEWYAILHRAQQQRSPIKVSDEMKFSFIYGMSKWWDNNDKLLFNRKSFLRDLPRTLCPNSEEDRLLDIRGFFNETPIISEIQEKIVQLSNGRLEWTSSYYDDEKPVNEEERMLRKFQEDNK